MQDHPRVGRKCQSLCILTTKMGRKWDHPKNWFRAYALKSFVILLDQNHRKMSHLYFHDKINASKLNFLHSLVVFVKWDFFGNVSNTVSALKSVLFFNFLFLCINSSDYSRSRSVIFYPNCVLLSESRCLFGAKYSSTNYQNGPLFAQFTP